MTEAQTKSSEHETVESYIRAQPANVQNILRLVRQAIRDAIPPTKWRKGSIRFPLCQGAPVELIRKISAFRAQEVTGVSASS